SAALPAGRWDDLDHAPRGTAPERRSATGMLQAYGEDFISHQGVFDAIVHPDGTVTLHDTANLNVHLALPTRKSIGDALQGWYYSDKGEYGVEGDTSLKSQIQASAGATATTKDPVTHETPDHTKTVLI